MKTLYILVIILMAIIQTTFSQVAINSDGNVPDGTAMLDVQSITKGILIPRMTTGQRSAISNPATGLIVYDSDQNHFYYFDGTTWVRFFDGALAINDLTDAASDQQSIFLGESAGNNDNGNNYNIGLGYKAAYTNTSGTFNSVLGYKSFYFNTSGQNNTSLGAFSMYNNTLGSSNVCLGGNANYFNQEGTQNCIIGYEAGKGTATHNKSGDIFIGYQAGFNETESNKLYIENSNSSSPLIYGEFDNDLLRINGRLYINNAYYFPTSDGTSGQVIRTNGSGILSWANGTGATEINELSDGKTGGNSVFLGTGAGNNDDASNNNNVGVGISALYGNTSGSNNTAVGLFALQGNHTGNGNTALGSNALLANSAAENNTAIGYFSLANTTGSWNTGVGDHVLYANGSGTNNVAIGINSLYSNTTGENNVGIGAYANYYNQEGDGNTMIGYQAGNGTAAHNTSGDIFIGFKAGFNETGSDKLYIENSNSSSPLIYGEFNNDLLRVNGTLDINNAYQLPTADGSSGQMLETDGSGNLSWTSDIGAGEINDLSDGKTGGQSVFLGHDAGLNDDGTTRNNVAIGFNALKGNTNGGNNVAIGFEALLNSASGNSNIAIGEHALYTQNTSVAHNLAIGTNALYGNTTGYNNVCIGNSTNFYNQEGNYNTMIGFEAGKGTMLQNITGDIFIGYQAGFYETGSNKLYIENSNSSAPLIYGEFDNNLLRVNGTLDINNAYQFPTSNGNTNQILKNSGGGTLVWGDLEINNLSDAKTKTFSMFLGSGSGDNITSSGIRNTATGVESMNNNTSGSNNTAI